MSTVVLVDMKLYSLSLMILKLKIYLMSWILADFFMTFEMIDLKQLVYYSFFYIFDGNVHSDRTEK